MKPVEFKVGGLTLRGNLFLADKPKKTAFLFLTGWTGHQNVKAAAMLAKHGYSSMTFDMPGHGDSDGELDKFTFSDFLEAAEAAYDFFKSKLDKKQEIALSGSSFGGYMAALLSTTRPIKALSLRVAANYPDEKFAETTVAVREETYELEEWRLQKATHEDNKALKAVREFKGPIQIIEAEKDEMVAAQTVRNYANAVKNPDHLEYILWKDAPHSIGVNENLQKQFEQFLLAWADNTEVE